MNRMLFVPGRGANLQTAARVNDQRNLKQAARNAREASRFSTFEITLGMLTVAFFVGAALRMFGVL